MRDNVSFSSLPLPLQERYSPAEMDSIERYGSSIYVVNHGPSRDRWELSGNNPNPSTWTWKVERSMRVTPSLYKMAVAVAERLKPEIVRRGWDYAHHVKAAYPDYKREFTGEVRYPTAKYPNFIGMCSLWELVFRDERGLVSESVLSTLPMAEMFPLFRKTFAPLGVPLDHPLIGLENTGDQLSERRPVVTKVVIEKDNPVYLRSSIAQESDIITGVKLEMDDDNYLYVQSDPLYTPSSPRIALRMTTDPVGRRIYANLGYLPGVHPLVKRGWSFTEVLKWDASSNSLTIGIYEGMEPFRP